MTRRKRPEHRGRTVRTTIRTTATPEQLFEAWADPAKLAQWFPDRAEGRAVEGGVQKWFFDRFNHALPYEVAAAVPPHRLSPNSALASYACPTSPVSAITSVMAA